MIDEYPPGVRADMQDGRRRAHFPDGGRHRAIRQHAFVQHRGDDGYGCGRWEDGEPEVRCGYSRKDHPAMLTADGRP